MGIRFSDSILAFFAATCFTLTSLLFGYGVAEKTAWPFVAAVVMVAASAGVAALVIRRVRGFPRADGGGGAAQAGSP